MTTCSRGVGVTTIRSTEHEVAERARASASAPAAPSSASPRPPASRARTTCARRSRGRSSRRQVLARVARAAPRRRALPAVDLEGERPRPGCARSLRDRHASRPVHAGAPAPEGRLERQVRRRPIRARRSWAPVSLHRAIVVEREERPRRLLVERHWPLLARGRAGRARAATPSGCFGSMATSARSTSAVVRALGVEQRRVVVAQVLDHGRRLGVDAQVLLEVAQEFRACSGSILRPRWRGRAAPSRRAAARRARRRGGW